MKRIPEPELMADPAQAEAYARADFEAPHSLFIDTLAERMPALPDQGYALDLGCGAADISIRFAGRFPGYLIDAVDGSEAMLSEAAKAIRVRGLGDRISLIQAMIADLDNTGQKYNCIFSNSLLHHLHDPRVLWDCVKRHADDSEVFIMDLLRPDSQQTVDKLVAVHAGNEPELLKRDFANSLLAAFDLPELRRQLIQAGLDRLQLEQISDRHMIIYGRC